LWCEFAWNLRKRRKGSDALLLRQMQLTDVNSQLKELRVGSKIQKERADV
jgi:hypothetical protein